MSYITKTNPDEMTFGTSLQGYITATYRELVELFGKPHDFFDDFKCDAEWYIEFDDGTVATIYNWKNGRNYCGPDAPPVEAITSWNIGGNTAEAADKILEVSSRYRLNVDRLRKIGTVKLPNDACGYCNGDCPNQPDDSEFLCDGFAGDIDGLYA